MSSVSLVPSAASDYSSLHRVSVEEPERFWRAVVDDLGLELARPWDDVLDDSRGIEWTTWFVGARLNIASACVHAWARTDARHNRGGLPGRRRRSARVDLRELSRETVQIAEALKCLRRRAGRPRRDLHADVPEAAVASHACAHIGAVQVPIFSGFARRRSSSVCRTPARRS